MQNMEELFKTAVDAMEQQVFAPVVMVQLAKRGYEAENEEEAMELLKCAAEVREHVSAGNIAPVPASALGEDGEMSKQASEAVSEDPLALAKDVDVTFDELDDVVKEASAVLTWAALKEETAA
jgi:hypothetical protein